ncbi:hypothetical protein WJX84_002126 [Apatococcus fuscideae]|uniref:Uncharacterized protein n=1 Tax=Apatococcus fuscideae TaxID=2026836 RepID=A0AAW1T5L6_9CHLO
MFFSRVFTYVFNELLVNTLSNNRAFQRFAIRSSELVQELSQKGKEQSSTLGDQAQTFAQTFSREVRKGFSQEVKGKQAQQPPRPDRHR